MRRVVIDGANDHAFGPRSYAGEGCTFQVSRVVARFHIFHLAVFAVRDPFGKGLQFSKIADWRDAAEIESRIVRELLDTN